MARRILTHSPIEFSAPAYLFEEVERHLPSLRHRAGLSRKQSFELLRGLRERMLVISEDLLLPFQEEAKGAMETIDPRDAAYVAAALAFPCEGIWSDDTHLKRQTPVKCWTTKELVAVLREHGVPL
jgi:predicted nucleic acid-binding protein